MAPVQAKTNSGATASLVIGSTQGWVAPTAGNLLVAFCNSNSTATAPTGAGTWTAGPSVVDGNGAYVWWKVATGTETTITFGNVADQTNVGVLEYSGIAASPFDVQNSATTSGSGALSTPSVSGTATAAGDLFLAFAMLHSLGNAAATGPSWTNSFTNELTTGHVGTTATNDVQTFVADLTAGAAGSVSTVCSWTTPSAQDRQALIIAFKAGSGGGGGGGGSTPTDAPAQYATGTPTQVAGVWTNPANAAGSTSGTYAAYTSTTRSAVATLELAGYDFSAVVPSDATLNSLTCIVKQYETVAGTPITSVQAQLFSGATQIGSTVNLTLSTTTTNSQTLTNASFGAMPTWAQLADLRVRIVVTRANSTTTATVNVDYASLSVNYTPALPSAAGAFSGSGTLAGTLTPKPTTSGSFSGSGSLAGTLTPEPTTSGSFGGSGSLAGTAAQALSVAGSFSGSGSLAGAASQAVSVAGSFGGSGTLAGSDVPEPTTAGSFGGSGTLAGTDVPELPVTGAFGGSGSLAGSDTPAPSSSGAFSGDGALAGSDVPVVPSSGVFSGDGALAGSALPPAGTGILEVQHASTQNAAATTGSITIPATVAGHFVCVWIARGTGAGSGAITSVTDSAGQTWSLATTGAYSGVANTRIELWYRENSASITSVSFVASASFAGTMIFQEFTGIASSASLDAASPANSQVSSATPSSPAIVTNGEDLVLAGYHSTATTITDPAPPWTAVDIVQGSTAIEATAWLDAVTPGTYSASWTLSATKTAGVLTAAFKAAAASLSVAGVFGGSGALAGSDVAVLSVAGSFSGSGSLAGSDIPALTSSGAFSGSGSLAGSDAPKPALTGSFGGSGSLAGSDVVKQNVSGAFSGSGALAGTVVAGQSVAGAFAGSGSLAGTLTPKPGATGAFAGDGTLAGTDVPKITTSGAFSGTGTLSGATGSTAIVTGAFTGSGSLAGSDVPRPASSGAFAGDGLLAGSDVAVITTSGAFAGLGSLAGTDVPRLSVAGAFSGLGSLSGTLGSTTSVSGAFSGSGTLAGSDVPKLTLAGAFAGLGTLTGSDAPRLTLTGGAFSGAGSLTGSAAPPLRLTTSGAFAGSGTLTVTAVIYTPPPPPPSSADPIIEIVDVADAIAKLNGFGLADDAIEYGAELFLIDAAGDRVDTLQDKVIYDRSSASVSWDCTANSNGSLTFVYGDELVWGKDIVEACQLIRSQRWNAANGYPWKTWHRFPLGHYVVTSPGRDDLDVTARRTVTGYDKNYLLQNNPVNSYSFAAGSTYFAAVQSVFRGAGLIGSTAALGAVVDYPGAWTTKTLPSSMTYPAGDGSTHLSIIAELLAASGCRPIYVGVDGRWKIILTARASAQAPLWEWSASVCDTAPDSLLARRIVKGRATRYAADVWNLPNQWVFVQQGLTFAPIEGSGQVTFNNVNTPPGGQEIVGRVVRSTQSLQASGQADLVTQGQLIVDDAIASAEQFTVTTRPWPAARHLDVWKFHHASLPMSSQRKLQTLNWTLPLFGGDMTTTARFASL